MVNLAGEYPQDNIITSELRLAGITSVWHDEIVKHAEVYTHVSGKLGKFELRRQWYYWSVSGYVPLAVAVEIYADPIGRSDVRAEGHCGCVDPADWAQPTREWHEEQGDIHFWMGIHRTSGDASRWIRETFPTVPRYIHGYHIDSQEGLCLFAAKLKEHKLDKE